MAFVFGAIPFTDALIVRYVDDRMRSRVAGVRLAIAFGVSSLAVWLLGPLVKANGFCVPAGALAAIAAVSAVAVTRLPASAAARRRKLALKCFAGAILGAALSPRPPSHESTRILRAVSSSSSPFAFVRPRRAARGRHAGRHRRRDHRIPARQRPCASAVPRRGLAEDERQRHVPRRLAPRELRRDGHGAPARAPGVQGHADARQHLGRS